MRKLKNSTKDIGILREFNPLFYAKYRLNLARLNKYAIIIGKEMQRKNKNAYDKAMALKPSKTVSSSTNNRQLHVSSVSKISRIIGEELGLNLNLIEVMADQHDRGHTFYAHEVEHIFNAFFENYGIGHFTHNAESPRQFLFIEDIDKICIDSIHRIYPELSKRKLEHLSDILWYIHDGALCHNGESPTFEFRPNIHKTREDFLSDINKSFTVKNYDRKLVPATIEGCLMKLSDIISYVGQDLADGLQEGLITDLDDEYISILSSFGLTASKLKNCLQRRDYDSIVRAVEDTCISDVIHHSNQSVIKMSPEMAKSVNALRHHNYMQVVRKNITKKEEQILSRTVGESIKLLSEHLINGRFLSELMTDGKINVNHDIQMRYPDEKYKGFVTFLGKLSPEYIDYVRNICIDGARASITEETQIAIECIRNGLDKLPEPENEKDIKYQAETPLRTQRINAMISAMKNKFGTDLSRFEPIEFCDKLVNKLEQNKPVDGYLTLEERMANLISTNFLATLSDKEYRYFLKVNKLVSTEEYDTLKTKYFRIPEEEFDCPASIKVTLEKTTAKDDGREI